MNKLFSNKKGASIDNIFVSITFFGLAIFLLAMTLTWNALNSGLTDVWAGSSIGTQIQGNAGRAVSQFDWISVIVWVGFHLGILVTSFLLRTHPVIYIVAILITAILALLAAPLSNAWVDMDNDLELTTAKDSLPMTNFILTRFPMLEIIWCFVTIIVMFGLAKTEGFV